MRRTSAAVYYIYWLKVLTIDGIGQKTMRKCGVKMGKFIFNSYLLKSIAVENLKKKELEKTLLSYNLI